MSMLEKVTTDESFLLSALWVTWYSGAGRVAKAQSVRLIAKELALLERPVELKERNQLKQYMHQLFVW